MRRISSEMYDNQYRARDLVCDTARRHYCPFPIRRTPGLVRSRSYGTNLQRIAHFSVGAFQGPGREFQNASCPEPQRTKPERRQPMIALQDPLLGVQISHVDRIPHANGMDAVAGSKPKSAAVRKRLNGAADQAFHALPGGLRTLGMLRQACAPVLVHYQIQIPAHAFRTYCVGNACER